jgi:hypothetical protein
VSDAFVLLGDAVMVFVGEADKAVGSSTALADALISISDAIKNAPDEAWFDKVFGALGDELARTIRDGGREIEYIAKILEFMAQLGDSPADALVGLNQEMGGAVRTAEEFELALTDAEQALANFATNTKGRFGDVDAAVQDLFTQILKGRGSVEAAHAAVDALAKVNPEFAELKAGVLSVIDTFFAMRDAALAARDAAANTTTDLGSSPTWRQFNKEFGPDLSSDGAPGGPIRPPSSGRSGGGGKPAGEKYGDSVEQFQRRIDMLKQETALTAALNPLLNDYGYAKERLKAIQELENAATRAGISLGPEQRAQIEALADGYASASAEAARLAESQNMLRQSAEELGRAGREALDTIIDGFLEGKDAGEVLNSVVKDLGRNLLKMGIDLIGGGMKQGGFNPLGFLGGLFGFASGTANTGGRKGEPRGIVHGQEAVIPLPSGGNVPVDLRMPSLPSSQPQSLQVHIVSDDEKLGAYVTDKAGKVVAQSAPGIVGASVSQANKSAPGAMAKFQQQRGGADYRTM